MTGETFVTRKVTRSVAQIHLGHMESVSQHDMLDRLCISATLRVTQSDINEWLHLYGYTSNIIC